MINWISEISGSRESEPEPLGILVDMRNNTHSGAAIFKKQGML